MEDKGYDVYFQDGYVLVRLRASNLSTRHVIGSKEGNLYMLKFYGKAGWVTCNTQP